ncbi:MAG TPA: wax ester/triacylglycerol synthase family O-acyltransferase [Burkholderiaceae bacterium]|nr:wax ester/triacylglycerol synthase family O-acyltransferase [Burkholderiaceae bacterium]
MSQHTRALTRVDTAWLRMDTDVNLMMIVGVWLLEPAVRYEDLCERVNARLLKYERFRQKVVQSALGCQWVPDEYFDLQRHVVIEKLARRRGQSERDALKQRMGELASMPLDYAHPLWQFHFVEHYDGGSASICRIHHCIGDGIALNSVMMSIADGAVAPPELERPTDDPDEAHHGDWLSEELLKPLTGAAVKAIDLYGDGLVKVLQVLEHPRRSIEDAAALVRDGRQLLGDAAALALMPDDSATPLKGHGSGRKVVAWCEPLPLDDVKAVGKALDASVNDVLLSSVAGAIGRYLRDEGDDPNGKDIRAMVPVNLRPLEQAWQLGNQFGLVPLLVPVGIANPIERLQVVHARMTALKVGYQPVLAYGILGVSGVLNLWGQRALSNLFLDKTTAVMTNVPGPSDPIRLCGATVRQSIFWVPSSGNVGVGVSIISYAGGVQFGLITDAKLCPQPSRIIDRFAQEFEQLLLLALMLPWNNRPARTEHAPR